MKTKLKHKHVKENNKMKNNNRMALPKISSSQRKFYSFVITLNNKEMITQNGNGKI